MSIYKKNATLLHNSYWTSNDCNMKNVIIHIKVLNDLNSPFLNQQYPYQLEFSLIGDDSNNIGIFIGGLDTYGNVAYQHLSLGQFITSDKIFWRNGGTFWNRIVKPRTQFVNRYDPKTVYSSDFHMNKFLQDRYQKAYSVNPGVSGL